MTTEPQAEVGRYLKHYKIEALLGQGGMGVVYKARDTKLERPVAIKLLPPELMSTADRRTRFFQEARSAAALTHPSIAQVYDIDEAEGSVFIAMEYVDGKTVGRLILDRELDLLGAVEIALQVAEDWPKRTRPASSTATSNPKMSWSPRTGTPSSSISGWPSSTRPSNRSPARRRTFPAP